MVERRVASRTIQIHKVRDHSRGGFKYRLTTYHGESLAIRKTLRHAKRAKQVLERWGTPPSEEDQYIGDAVRMKYLHVEGQPRPHRVVVTSNLYPIKAFVYEFRARSWLEQYNTLRMAIKGRDDVDLDVRRNFVDTVHAEWFRTDQAMRDGVDLDEARKFLAGQEGHRT